MHRLSVRQRIAAVVLGTLAVCFLTLDVTGGQLHDAHSGARGLLGSLYRGTDSVFGPVRRFVQAVPSAGHDSARIAQLQRQNAALQAQVAASTVDAATSAQLQKLQLLAGTGGLTIVPARVIGFGPGQGFEWTVTIDIGRSSGVAVDQTVTDADGIVGRILHADASTSVVLLAADPGSGIGVRDIRNGELGLATGAGTNGFTVTPLNPGADLHTGDQLETGPAGASTYVGGLPVGTISAVHDGADGAVTATVKPATPPTELDLVGVITAAKAATAPRPSLTGASK